MYKKLFTKEDSHYFHLHKILGSSCLINFSYRLFWFLSSPENNLGFIIGSNIYLCTLLVHALLHVSSFQFILSSRRNAVYNIIWPEMRWHSLLFAYRSLLIMLLFAFNLDIYVANFARYLLVIATMVSADYVTYVLPASNDTTTMRGNPYPKDTSEYIIKYLNYFYSISQVFATLHMLFAPNVDYIYLTLIPIQTAPFGMTLQRKGIISQFGWHVFYIFAILTNYVYSAVNIYKPELMWGCMMAFSVLRFKFKMNKYILWTLVYMSSLFI
jgi:hypothetical protein